MFLLEEERRTCFTLLTYIEATFKAHFLYIVDFKKKGPFLRIHSKLTVNLKPANDVAPSFVRTGILYIDQFELFIRNVKARLIFIARLSAKGTDRVMKQSGLSHIHISALRGRVVL